MCFLQSRYWMDPTVLLFGTNILKNLFRIGKRWQKTEQTTISWLPLRFVQRWNISEEILYHGTVTWKIVKSVVSKRLNLRSEILHLNICHTNLPFLRLFKNFYNFMNLETGYKNAKTNPRDQRIPFHCSPKGCLLCQNQEEQGEHQIQGLLLNKFSYIYFISWKSYL